ncbi:IS3 family transposase [Streptomyces sp. NPDC002659]|uniref:IS3 family transposase n=1 Tax=Streptomyces sp. NPDC002659 TaxID=3364656 RepID=UPI0036993DB7
MTESDPAALAAFIGNQRAEHHVPHRLACRVLGVWEFWFYKWRDKPTTAREVRRGKPTDAIKGIFEGSGGTYGSPKIWIILVREGWRVSVNIVAKLMAELGLAGRKIRWRRRLTRPGERAAAPDFVRRDFTADAPDQVWAGDVTEIVTGEGRLYLATVIDLFSGRLAGYAMGERHNAELVVASLQIATPPLAAM